MAAGFARLPTELIELILDEVVLDGRRQEIKALRQACKELEQKTFNRFRAVFFNTITTTLSKESLLKWLAAANHKRLTNRIFSLSIVRVCQHEKFGQGLTSQQACSMLVQILDKISSCRTFRMIGADPSTSTSCCCDTKEVNPRPQEETSTACFSPEDAALVLLSAISNLDEMDDSDLSDSSDIQPYISLDLYDFDPQSLRRNHSNFSQVWMWLRSLSLSGKVLLSSSRWVAKIIEEAKNLQILDLHCNDERRDQIYNKLRTTRSLPPLRELTLSRVELNDQSLLGLIFCFKDSLHNLNLMEVCLVGSNWRDIFNQLKVHLTHLNSILVDALCHGSFSTQFDPDIMDLSFEDGTKFDIQCWYSWSPESPPVCTAAYEGKYASAALGVLAKAVLV